MDFCLNDNFSKGEAVVPSTSGSAAHIGTNLACVSSEIAATGEGTREKGNKTKEDGTCLDQGLISLHKKIRRIVKTQDFTQIYTFSKKKN